MMDVAKTDADATGAGATTFRIANDNFLAVLIFMVGGAFTMMPVAAFLALGPHPGVFLGLAATLVPTAWFGLKVWPQIRGRRGRLTIGPDGIVDERISDRLIPWDKIPSVRATRNFGGATRSLFYSIRREALSEPVPRMVRLFMGLRERRPGVIEVPIGLTKYQLMMEKDIAAAIERHSDHRFEQPRDEVKPQEKKLLIGAIGSLILIMLGIGAFRLGMVDEQSATIALLICLGVFVVFLLSWARWKERQ